MIKQNQQPGEVTFSRAFKDFWRGYVDFTGRTTRAGYWWPTLLYSLWIFFVIMLLFVGFAQAFSYAATGEGTGDGIFYVALVLVAVSGLGLFLPCLALTVRRCRDAGLRGRGYLTLQGSVLAVRLLVWMVAGITVQFGDTTTMSGTLTTIALISYVVLLLTYAVGIFVAVVTFFPTDTILVRPTSNAFMKFFFRVRVPYFSESGIRPGDNR